MKVILREDIPRLGDAGDLVTVKPGYARNFLLPKGLALPATEARVKEVEHHRRIIEAKQSKLLKDLKGAAKAIREMDLSFEAQAGESGKLFGSITAMQIAERITSLGIDIDRRRIQMDAIKTVGDHPIKIRLHKELVVDAKVAVVRGGAPPPEPELLVEEPEPIGLGSMEE